MKSESVPNLGLERQGTQRSQGLQRGNTRLGVAQPTLTKQATSSSLAKSQSEGALPPFDVWSEFDFFVAWKQEPAVRRVLQEKMQAKIRKEKAQQQRKEEMRLMHQGWHRLSAELARRGLPNLGSQSDLARRLLVALQAEEAAAMETGEATAAVTGSVRAGSTKGH